MPPRKFKPVADAAAPVVAEPEQEQAPRPSVTTVRMGNGTTKILSRKKIMPAMIEWQTL